MKLNYEHIFPTESEIKFVEIDGELQLDVSKNTKEWYKRLKGLKRFNNNSFIKYVMMEITKYKEQEAQKFIDEILSRGE